ncbi:MAG: GNAT family N-acetyltransferase [Anaerolineae bacterium]|nr:GNAT family N-acetyltransferase [Anaerolineae bacterium]
MAIFEIRRYKSIDHDAAWQLHNLALSLVGAHAGNGPWDDDLHSIEAVYLQNGGEFLVGLLDGQIVAMGALRRVDDGSADTGSADAGSADAGSADAGSADAGSADTAWAEIKRMRVHPDHQRRGYGQAILARLEARAVELGYTRLILDTTTVQIGAQRFYEKNGYRQFDQTTFGSFDVLLYQKELRGSP